MRIGFWIIICCLVSMFPQTTNAQGGDAQAQIRKILRIVPAESKSEDVKKLLGEPLDKSPDFFKFDNFNVMITYSSGLLCDAPCVEKGRAADWTVPRDTVIGVYVFVTVAFHQRDLMNLNIDLNKYKKGKPDHIGTVSYSDDEAGIGININGNQVEGISLFPAKKYFHLICTETSSKPVCPRSQRDRQPSPKPHRVR